MIEHSGYDSQIGHYFNINQDIENSNLLLDDKMKRSINNNKQNLSKAKDDLFFDDENF